MTTSARDRPTVFNLSRKETWIVHVALLDATEWAVDVDKEPTPASGLLARAKAGDEDFDSAELGYLADVLQIYQTQAPARDDHHIPCVLERIEAARAWSPARRSPAGFFRLRGPRATAFSGDTADTSRSSR